MKKFKQLLEDIELVSGHPRTTKRDMHDYYTPDAEYAQGVQLVLKPKVKKKK